MTARRLALLAAILLGIAALLFLPRRSSPPEKITATASAAVPTAPTKIEQPKIARRDLAAIAAENPLAAELNAPSGTIRRDLEVLNELFTNFQTNFPRTGNPVGENAEITAALTGDNPLHFAFVPKNHPAINDRGELCDRWGTPFRFHQLSGTVMEIRSAGPDKKFGTPDDAEFSPEAGRSIPR